MQQGHEASDAIEHPAWKLGFGKARMEESIGLINITLRSEWFLQQGHEASDAIEHPAWKLGFGKARMEESIGLINITFQLSSMILCVYLAFKGYVAPAVIAGSVNLIGSVSNGLASFANQRLLLSASKPYFDKITVHAGEASQSESRLPALQQGITVSNGLASFANQRLLLSASKPYFDKITVHAGEASQSESRLPALQQGITVEDGTTDTRDRVRRPSGDITESSSRSSYPGCAVQKRRQICPYRSFGLRQEHAAEDPAGLAAGVSGYRAL